MNIHESDLCVSASKHKNYTRFSPPPCIRVHLENAFFQPLLHNYSFPGLRAAWGNLDVKTSQTLSIPTGVSLGSAVQSKLSRAAHRIDVQ